jgi:hypothetical protein
MEKVVMTEHRTDNVVQVLEQLYVINLRPPTLKEIGAHLGVTAVGVFQAIQSHLQDGTVVKLPGARGYMPSWSVQMIAAEGLRRIQDEEVRAKIKENMNMPTSARITDCMRNQIGVMEFPNPSTSGERTRLALEVLDPQGLVLDSILPTGIGYDVIVHPQRCSCGSENVAYKCVCNAWICDDCRPLHRCS